MEERLIRHWYTSRTRLSPLIPLSWLYGAVVAVRRQAYRRGWLSSRHPGAPVLVVGNLTVGGTGKTPLTLWLAQQLTASGIKVGVVTRGHGRKQDTPESVGPTSTWEQVGDEPLLIWQRCGCPVLVSRDRVAASRTLVEQGCELILADDGLQHLKLQRDCEIVVIDGARGFGNARLLPAGPMRERAARALSSDVIRVLNGPAYHPSLQNLPPHFTMQLTGGEAVPLDGGLPIPLSRFQAEPVHAVAGIGHPQRFFASLADQGLTLMEHPFGDHHPFTAGDLDFGDERPVLMTEKDAVKCRAFARPGMWYVPVQASFAQSAARDLLRQVRLKLRIS